MEGDNLVTARGSVGPLTHHGGSRRRGTHVSTYLELDDWDGTNQDDDLQAPQDRPEGAGGDVLIGYDRKSSEHVVLRYEDRDRGVSINGKSGTGKSSLLEHLILADLEQGTPGMVI